MMTWSTTRYVVMPRSAKHETPAHAHPQGHEAVEEFNETNLLQLEVQALKLDGYRAGYLVSELYGVTTMVGFSVADLTTDTILRAAGLRKDLHVVISLTFPSSPPQYLAKCPGHGKVTVRQSSDTCLDNKQTLTDSVEFGLWWTLEQLLQEHLNKNWDSLKEKCLEEIERARARDKDVPWDQVTCYSCLCSLPQCPEHIRCKTP